MSRFIHKHLTVNNQKKFVVYVGLTEVTVRENKRLVRYPHSSVHPADLAIALNLANLGPL